MNFVQSIKTCLRKYADFKGRAMRSEFWWFQLLIIILSIIAMTIDHLVLGYTLDNAMTPLVVIFAVGFVVPSASVAARRLHDIGWSGWVQLPMFLTYLSYLDVWFPDFSLSLIGTTLISVGMLFWIILLIILIKDSQPKTNKYGPNPKAPEMGEVFS